MYKERLRYCQVQKQPESIYHEQTYIPEGRKHIKVVACEACISRCYKLLLAQEKQTLNVELVCSSADIGGKNKNARLLHQEIP